LENVILVKREWTKVGFYLTYELQEINNIELIEGIDHIDGPYIESQEIELNGGSILWIERGKAKTIELFSYGNRFGENIHQYKLCEVKDKREQKEIGRKT
jgi:hypothetical protein